MALGSKERFKIEFQRCVDRALFPFTAVYAIVWLRVVNRFKIPNIKEIRRKFAELESQGTGPLLICGNHLTLVDTVIKEWALTSNARYLRRFSLFPWSLPEKKNFANHWFWKVAAYLGKCIYIVRKGPPEETKLVLDKVKYLLERGEAVSIFPEGGRSRVGRVDTENFAYGTGKIIQSVANPRVLCVFLRGKHQREYTDFPMRGEEFYVDIEMIHPRSPHKGLRADRDLATQVIQKLAEMEKRFFEVVRPEWHMPERNESSPALM
jgi:1-acyl-sn-glycerol-3-phosphate acyltransferase